MSEQLSKQIAAAKAKSLAAAAEARIERAERKERELDQLATDFVNFIGNGDPSGLRCFVNNVTDRSVLLGSAESDVPIGERKSFSVDRAMFPEGVHKNQRWEIAIIGEPDYTGSGAYLTAQIEVLGKVQAVKPTLEELLARVK